MSTAERVSVRSGPLRRLGHWLRGLVSTEARARTTEEQRLADRVAELEAELRAALEQAASHRQEAAGFRSELQIAGLEIEKLNDVVARDRARVQAEAAVYVRQAADAAGPRAGDGEGVTRVAVP